MTADLPAVAVAVVLCSALVHASWNVMLARAPRGHDTTAIAVTVGLLAWTPIALARWRVESGVWPYVLASAALELAYFAALNFAYARVPAHAAYPVARGLAPTLLLPVALAAGADVPAVAMEGRTGFPTPSTVDRRPASQDRPSTNRMLVSRRAATAGTMATLTMLRASSVNPYAR